MFKLLIRNKWRSAFLAYTLYIIYGTTLPFRFTLSGDIIINQLHKLVSLRYYASLPSSTIQLDGISNILFFIPFGLFFYNSEFFRRKGYSGRKSIQRIIVSGALLSMFVEMLQVFTVNRSPSILDILTNTAGTYLGASLGFFLMQRGLGRWLNRQVNRLYANPDLFLISMYGIYLLMASLAPFNINLSPFRIYHQLSSVTPLEFSFEGHPTKIFGILYIFAPAGYIISRTIRRFFQWPYMTHTGIALMIGFVTCFFVEILQLFVNYRHFSWSDIYLGWIGILYGLFSYQLLHRNLFGKNIRGTWTGHDYGAGLFYFFTLNYIVFLFYKFLYPFQFDLPQFPSKLDFFLLNLYSYIPSKNLFDLLAIFVKNVIMFIPAGIIFSEDKLRYPRRWRSALIFMFIFIAKSMQLFNAQQTPLLYDFFGMAVGIGMGYIFWGEVKIYLFEKRPG